jgi:hypothetical protein
MTGASSSSSAWVGELVTEPCVTEPCEPQLKPLSLSGHVELTLTARGWAATNLLTCQVSYLLPQHVAAWTFEFDDDDGSGAFFEHDGEAFVPVHEVFSEELLQSTSSGDLFLKRNSATCNFPLFSTLLRERRQINVTVKTGVLGTDLDLTAVVFHRKRACGQQIYWPVQPLYKMFGLTTFKGYGHNWVLHQKGRWDKKHIELFGSTLSCGATHGNMLNAKLADVDYSDRCLDFHSYSTLGFLFMLSRFAFSPAHAGGFSKEQVTAIDGATLLLRKITDQLFVDPAPLELGIVVVPEWECTWPMPAGIAPVFVVTLKIDRQLISFDELDPDHHPAINDPLAARTLKKWWKGLGLTVQDAPLVMSLLDFLKAIVKSADSKSLMAQVLFGLSHRIEKAFAASLAHAGSEQSGDGPHTSWSDTKAGDYDWLAKLPQYIANGVASTQYDLDCIYSTDKAWVGGLPMSNTSFRSSTGELFIAAPLVIGMT